MCVRELNINNSHKEPVGFVTYYSSLVTERGFVGYSNLQRVGGSHRDDVAHATQQHGHEVAVG